MMFLACCLIDPLNIGNFYLSIYLLSIYILYHEVLACCIIDPLVKAKYLSIWVSYLYIYYIAFYLSIQFTKHVYYTTLVKSRKNLFIFMHTLYLLYQNQISLQFFLSKNLSKIFQKLKNLEKSRKVSKCRISQKHKSFPNFQLNVDFFLWHVLLICIVIHIDNRYFSTKKSVFFKQSYFLLLIQESFTVGRIIGQGGARIYHRGRGGKINHQVN